MAKGFLLQPMPTLVEFGAGQGDSVERFHHDLHCFDGFDCSTLESCEPIHRDDLHAISYLIRPSTPRSRSDRRQSATDRRTSANRTRSGLGK